MTSFGDVNIGDKVRLTDGDEEHVVRVKEKGSTLSGQACITAKRESYYEGDYTLVEVLEPAPKPRPTEPGVYQDSEGLLYRLYPDGTWCDLRPEVTVMESVDLQPVVPVSAVDEARSAAVAEIVEFVKHHTALWDTAELLERKFGGGKS